MRPNALMLSVLLAAPAGAQSVAEDPYLWLEGVEDAKALDWVRGENAKTQAELKARPNSPPCATTCARSWIPTPASRA